MALTLSDYEAQLTALKAAYLKAVNAHAYGHGDKNLTRQRLDALRAEMREVNNEIKRLTRGGLDVRRIVPIDG